MVEIFRETPLTEVQLKARDADTMLSEIQAMEYRYAFENELLQAVATGRNLMNERYLSVFSVDLFEKRVPDQLRNAKNYGIIMNTLLRKAAEQGGVHPFDLDRISSQYAKRIETLSAVGRMPALMQEMFREYCRLVRRNSLRRYSPAVAKTILTITADLAADLSPGILAASQQLSLGYLSTVFRQETGQTLSAFIRERRMEYAKHLLSTTSLQIQTVALHCGILDVQYFTKMFRKEFGMTPTAYRQSLLAPARE